jgi:cation transport ATPase
LTVRATQAAFLALPSLCGSFGISGGEGLGIILAGYVVTFVTWAAFTDAYGGMSSVPALMKLFIAVGIGIAYLVPFIPNYFLAGAVVVSLIAWADLLRGWPEIPPPNNARSGELRQLAIRQSRISFSIHAVSSILVLIAVLRWR